MATTTGPGDFVLKMMNVVLKMMNVVLKMMGFCIKITCFGAASRLEAYIPLRKQVSFQWNGS